MVVIESELSVLIVDRVVLVLLVMPVSPVEIDAVLEVDLEMKESKDDDSAEVELYKVLVGLVYWVTVALKLPSVVSWELVVLIVEKLLGVS